MAPFVQTSPRKDGKTPAQADADNEKDFMTYHTQEEERSPIGTGDTTVPPADTSKAKAKAPARKQATKTKGASNAGPKKDEDASSPLVRKSARVADKRKAPLTENSEADGEQAQPATKKTKPSPKNKAIKRKSPSPEDPDASEGETQKPIKKTKPSSESKAIKRKSPHGDSSDIDEDGTQQPLKKTKSTSKKTTIPDAGSEKATSVPPSEKAEASPPATGAPRSPTGYTDTEDEDAEAPKVVGKSDKGKGKAPVQEAIEGTKSDIGSVTEHEDAETDDNEESVEAAATAGKGKGKKAATNAFKGTKSGFGTSVEKPEDAPNDEPWQCANRDCNSGQTYHPRDGPSSFGRKVISNFFGRNKKQTNLIDPDVWHNYCRKCYQRSSYRVNVLNSQEKIKYYVNNIEMQLDRIELWRPEATFTDSVTKGANDRLSKFYKERSKQGATPDSAKAAVTKTPATNSKGKVKPLSLEEAFPVDLLENFEDNRAGTNQSFTDLKLILNWITNMAENGMITTMPPMEFLINVHGGDEEIIDPKTNYDRFCAKEDGQRAGEAVDDEGESEDAGAAGEADPTGSDAGEGDGEGGEGAEDEKEEKKEGEEGEGEKEKEDEEDAAPAGEGDPTDDNSNGGDSAGEEGSSEKDASVKDEEDKEEEDEDEEDEDEDDDDFEDEDEDDEEEEEEDEEPESEEREEREDEYVEGEYIGDEDDDGYPTISSGRAYGLYTQRDYDEAEYISEEDTEQEFVLDALEQARRAGL